jgi:hydroxypyruvate isomerase
MSKTFTFAGTCVENGAVVYKFANDASRAKALERFGCTDINMVELPNAMDKEAAVAYLATQGMTATKAVRATKAAKPAKTVPAKLPKVKTTGDDEVTRESYAEAMGERKVNGMPVVSFAQYKRDAAKAVAFFAKCDSKLAAKRAAGKAL